jgi:transaldolase
VTAAENLQEQKRKYLFTFLQEKKAALFALGIVIYVPDHGNMAIRYARVITQIQKLSPEKQTMLNHLRDQFIQEERLKEEKVKEAARIEEEKERLRQELQEQMSKKKKNAIKNFNYDMPVDEMPDCRQKYLKILEEADGGKLFTDV